MIEPKKIQYIGPKEVDVAVKMDAEGLLAVVGPNGVIRYRLWGQFYIIDKLPKASCKHCYGRGTIGYDRVHRVIVPCRCIGRVHKKVPVPQVNTGRKAVVETPAESIHAEALDNS